MQVAVDAAELPAGFDHPGRASAQGHGGVCRFFTLLEWVRAMEIIDSMQLIGERLVDLLLARSVACALEAVPDSSVASALRGYLVGHLEQAQHGHQDQTADQVAKRGEGEQPEPLGIAERCPGV